MVTNSQEYIRNYKKKQFQENPEYWNAMNRKYRARKYYNLSQEDMQKYDLALPLVGKAWKILDEIQNEYPHIMQEVIAKYIENPAKCDE